MMESLILEVETWRSKLDVQKFRPSASLFPRVTSHSKVCFQPIEDFVQGNSLQILIFSEPYTLNLEGKIT